MASVIRWQKCFERSDRGVRCAARRRPASQRRFPKRSLKHYWEKTAIQRRTERDDRSKTNEQRERNEEASTWRCDEPVNERSTRRRRRASLERFSREKRYWDSLRNCRCPRSFGFLGDATDETDNYRFATGLEASSEGARKRARDVIVRAADASSLRHFSFPLIFFLSSSSSHSLESRALE